MNKTDFIKHIRTELKCEQGDNLRYLTEDDARGIINDFIKCLTSALVKDGEVSLVGFGRFYTARVSARTGRNPRTGESITISGYIQPRFRSGKTLKDSCNKTEIKSKTKGTQKK